MQAGFTGGRWIPVADDHDVVNAENELADPHSVFADTFAVAGLNLATGEGEPVARLSPT